ncbi:type I glyceraldehyde-3-phosphate dehydrogenase [Wandonia haliotis]|uniref:Type I glyceraldehyde-3-phosphate dehydrogenase n=1 Tax=Wandonia haliotis TaxID=574963 RepID=A0ABP3Y2D0_9FLAO
MRIGVNGFGRIGRYFTRLSLEREDMDVVMVNDLAPIETLAHLLKYDSVHGKLKYDFTIHGNEIHFCNGKKLSFTSEKDPAQINWGAKQVDYVLESTGLFRSSDKAALHLGDTVKKVVISAPAKGDDVKTVVIGVNDHLLEAEDTVVSNASCTTNSAAPLVAVLKEICTIKSAYITTVHSYTSDQRLHDAPHSDLRRARAAAQSIVPTSTGAAKALTRIFPELDGFMGGCGIRVPVPDGSLTDLTIVVDKAPTVAEINAAFKKASETNLKGILSYIEDPVVSVDILDNPHSCIFDSLLTSVIGDNMIKVVGWYDNEAGYSNRLIDLMTKLK